MWTLKYLNFLLHCMVIQSKHSRNTAKSGWNLCETWLIVIRRLDVTCFAFCCFCAICLCGTRRKDKQEHERPKWQGATSTSRVCLSSSLRRLSCLPHDRRYQLQSARFHGWWGYLRRSLIRSSWTCLFWVCQNTTSEKQKYFSKSINVLKTTFLVQHR